MSSLKALPALLFTALALGQTPPPEVDQALRARVDQFLRYHVEGGANLRKAIDMVAEDTKDEYFAGAKIQVQHFEIKNVEYDADFTKAVVTVDVARKMAIFGQAVEMTFPMRTSWKIEGGQWMYYVDPTMVHGNPMADGPISTGGAAPTTGGGPSPEALTPEAIAARAKDILRPSSLDKSSVTLKWGQASEDQVMFLNQYPGADLELGTGPAVPGLEISLDKPHLAAKENGVIRFRYAPPPGFDASSALPMPFVVTLGVIPFNQLYRIEVRFTAP